MCSLACIDWPSPLLDLSAVVRFTSLRALRSGTGGHEACLLLGSAVLLSETRLHFAISAARRPNWGFPRVRPVHISPGQSSEVPHLLAARRFPTQPARQYFDGMDSHKVPATVRPWLTFRDDAISHPNMMPYLVSVQYFDTRHPVGEVLSSVAVGHPGGTRSALDRFSETSIVGRRVRGGVPPHPLASAERLFLIFPRRAWICFPAVLIVLVLIIDAEQPG